GQRADVGTPGARRELPRLQGVEQVADEHRHRRARQDPPIDEVGGKPEHAAAQRIDEEKLHQVVDREAEETVDVAAYDPVHAAEDITQSTSNSQVPTPNSQLPTSNSQPPTPNSQPPIAAAE